MVFEKIKKAFAKSMKGEDFEEEDYRVLDVNEGKEDNKVLVKLFVLKNYDDVTEILNALREGYTIAIIDIKILRQKDSIELKRAIAKIKKTTDALEGSIAGFGENTVIVTPSFAKIHKEASHPQPEKHNKFE